MSPRWITEYETLKKSDRPSFEELDEDESYVKVGDPVVQVIEENNVEENMEEETSQ